MPLAFLPHLHMALELGFLFLQLLFFFPSLYYLSIQNQIPIGLNQTEGDFLAVSTRACSPAFLEPTFAALLTKFQVLLCSQEGTSPHISLACPC